MSVKDWTVFYKHTARQEETESRRHSTKASALWQAHSYKNLGYGIMKIEGSAGQIITAERFELAGNSGKYSDRRSPLCDFP